MARRSKKSAKPFVVRMSASSMTAALCDTKGNLVANVWGLPEDTVGDLEAKARMFAAMPALLPAITKLIAAVQIAMDAEGNAFGIHHNDAVDALIEGGRALELATGKSTG
jgi:hypothetical protein